MAENENTIIEGQETKKARSDEEFVNKLRGWSKRKRDSRTREELGLYEIEVVVAGSHYMAIPDKDRSTSTSINITPIRKRKGEIMRTYNKTRSLLRVLKANTTSTEIRYEVQGGKPEEIMASNYLNWYVDRDPTFNEIVGDVVTLGFKRKTAYFYPHWDSQKLEPIVMACDPFDLLVDRYGKYALRTYTMRKEDLKNAKGEDGESLFKNTDNLKGTSKRSASDIYNNYLTNKNQGGNGDDEMSDVMLEEYHIIEQKEEVEEGQASAGK